MPHQSTLGNSVRLIRGADNGIGIITMGDDQWDFYESQRDIMVYNITNDTYGYLHSSVRLPFAIGSSATMMVTRVTLSPLLFCLFLYLSKWRLLLFII